MSPHNRLIRAARKAKAQRLARWQGVPTPSSHFATDGVTPARKRLGKRSRADYEASTGATR